MNVVGVIQRRIEALRIAFGNISFINIGSANIGERRVLITADPKIDMAWHMDQMPRSRHQIGERISGTFSLLGV